MPEDNVFRTNALRRCKLIKEGLRGYQKTDSGKILEIIQRVMSMLQSDQNIDYALVSSLLDQAQVILESGYKSQQEMETRKRAANGPEGGPEPIDSDLKALLDLFYSLKGDFSLKCGVNKYSKMRKYEFAYDYYIRITEKAKEIKQHVTENGTDAKYKKKIENVDKAVKSIETGLKFRTKVLKGKEGAADVIKGYNNLVYFTEAVCNQMDADFKQANGKAIDAIKKRILKLRPKKITGGTGEQEFADLEEDEEKTGAEPPEVEVDAEEKKETTLTDESGPAADEIKTCLAKLLLEQTSNDGNYIKDLKNSKSEIYVPNDKYRGHLSRGLKMLTFIKGLILNSGKSEGVKKLREKKEADLTAEEKKTISLYDAIYRKRRHNGTLIVSKTVDKYYAYKKIHTDISVEQFFDRYFRVKGLDDIEEEQQEKEVKALFTIVDKSGNILSNDELYSACLKLDKREDEETSYISDFLYQVQEKNEEVYKTLIQTISDNRTKFKQSVLDSLHGEKHIAGGSYPFSFVDILLIIVILFTAGWLLITHEFISFPTYAYT